MNGLVRRLGSLAPHQPKTQNMQVKQAIMVNKMWTSAVCLLLIGGTLSKYFKIAIAYCN